MGNVRKQTPLIGNQDDLHPEVHLALNNQGLVCRRRPIGAYRDRAAFRRHSASEMALRSEARRLLPGRSRHPRGSRPPLVYLPQNLLRNIYTQQKKSPAFHHLFRAGRRQGAGGHFPPSRWKHSGPAFRTNTLSTHPPPRALSAYIPG